jgi:hypothetical protein
MFPHSRPSSWAGSQEDMMFMMQKSPSSPGHRPNSGMYSSGGSNEDWQQTNRAGSKGDLRQGTQPWASAEFPAAPSNGHRYASLNGSKKSSKKPNSPPKNTPTHQRQISSKSAPDDSHSKSHSHSQSHHRQKSTTPSIKSTGRGNEALRSTTHPPLPTTMGTKSPYGLSMNNSGSQQMPPANNYTSGSASVGKRSGLSQSHSKDMPKGTSNTPATTTTPFGSFSMRSQRPSHLKNETTSSERRSRLFA